VSFRWQRTLFGLAGFLALVVALVELVFHRDVAKAALYWGMMNTMMLGAVVVWLSHTRPDFPHGSKDRKNDS